MKGSGFWSPTNFLFVVEDEVKVTEVDRRFGDPINVTTSHLEPGNFIENQCYPKR
jgi:hypothetical protein